MKRVRRIRQVDHHPEWDGSGGGWSILLDHEDGTPWCYAFPALALWCRSAEYGIDPSDVETLLDIVLHELALTSIGQGLTGDEPDFVYHAEEGIARTGHLARIDRAKDMFDHPDLDGLLQTIKDFHVSRLSDPESNRLHQQTRNTVHSIRRQRGLLTKERANG